MRDDDFVPPALPDEIAAEDLDIGARAQLKTLSKDNAEVVAKHMAMAGRLIDDDPELAHQHALAAARRAGRIGVVRETLAITAYQLGDFSLALRELRTYRRITGRDDQLPLMADCERGLGRPEKALELARSVDAATLDTEVRVELAIVKSGARLDLGQPDAALEELRIPELRKDKAFDYSPALFASYAGVLEELGREEEAAEWFALADRAIDALEDALKPGELEAVSIISERIEVEQDDDLAAEHAASEPGDADEAEQSRVAADEARAADPAAAVEAEPVEPAPVAADERADGRDDVATGPVGVADAPAGVADAPAGVADAPAGVADAPVVEGGEAEGDVRIDEPTASDEGDALFGDALFGDDMIDDTDQEPERDGDAR